MDLIRHFEKQQIQDIDRPQLQAGDIVRVSMRVTEGDKTRLQTFEGTVLGVRGSGPSVTFTVRRQVGNFGVERIFPLYSPLIESIDIVKRQKVRRAKLTYLRLAGRRRFKEDLRAMQRHERDEAEKQRLAEEARKRVEEKQRKEEAAARAKAEEKAKTEQEEKVKHEGVDTENEVADTADVLATDSPEASEPVEKSTDGKNSSTDSTSSKKE